MPQRASKGRIELKPTQERVLAALAENGSGRLTRGRYEDIAGVSRSQAAYDLAELVEAGILERVGGGRATTYRLVRRSRPSGQRHWTNERIHAALEDFCAGRKTWPSASEFKADGHSDLYVAASRYGGIGYWATELGFDQPSRATTHEPAVRSWRPRLGWAAGGAALAATVFAVAGAAVYALRDSPAREAAAPQALRASGASQHKAPARAAANTVAPAKQKHTRARQTRRSPTTPRVQTSTPTYRTELAVQRVSVSPSTRSASSTPRQESTSSSTPSGPAPLAPPAGGGSGGPEPLPPPR
jgi:hypothetical protein